jgi:Zn-dependent protease with chaperone function
VTQECPVRVWVEQSTSMNAGGTVVDDPACPGTIRMFFTTGLLDGMTFLELRAIIAHELGHVALNHGATAAHRRQNEAMARNASSATWGVVGAAGSAIPVYGPAVQLGAWVAENVTNLTIGLVARGYDRDQEREADRWAARILLRLDGTEGCRYLQSAFQRLARANPRGLELFATHPDAGDRAEDARLLCEVGARPEDVKSR